MYFRAVVAFITRKLACVFDLLVAFAFITAFLVQRLYVFGFKLVLYLPAAVFILHVFVTIRALRQEREAVGAIHHGFSSFGLLFEVL